MKTILCPTELTEATDQVVKYAAQMARDTQAKIVLAAAETKQSKVLAHDFEKNKDTEMLEELHDLLKMDYHISCAIEKETISSDTQLCTLADSYDVLALGMKFKNNSLPKNSAGFDWVKVIQNTFAPLLIVPEKFEYQKINRILYAFDYKHEPEPPLMALHWLSEWFNVEVRFLSILKNDISHEEENKIDLIRNGIANQWKAKKELTFEDVSYKNVPQCLAHYLNVWSRNDLLVLSVNHNNMFTQLWHKSVIKKLLSSVAHPYLIIHK